MRKTDFERKARSTDGHNVGDYRKLSEGSPKWRLGRLRLLGENHTLSLRRARQAVLLAPSRAMTSSPGMGFTLPLSRSS